MPRLLLVEDAPDVALVVAHLGRRMGLEVVHRSDVASAWESARQAPPDLVLLDLNLPGERGEVLCRRLRSAPAPARVPVALFIHGTCQEDLVSGLEAGADYVVSKDLLGRPAAWQERVCEILEARDGQGGVLSIRCHRNVLLPPPTPEVIAALNRALCHPLMRQLGPDVMRLVLRRALDRVGLDTAGRDRWLEPGGGALDVSNVLAAADSAAVGAFAVAITEQLQRLLGTEASAPAREALGTAVEGLSG